MGKIKSTKDTILTKDVHDVKSGKVYEVESMQDLGNGNAKVKLAHGAGEWIIRVSDWEDADTKPSIDSNDTSAKPSIDWNDMSAKVSKYFTVGEVTHNSKERIPTDPATIGRIIRLAHEADKVREAWGSALIVTSWHRPLAVNRRIGSGDRSRHIKGDAFDVRPANGQLLTFQAWIDSRWYGALGYGAKRGFVHLDMRNGKGFKTGGSKSARWNY